MSPRRSPTDNTDLQMSLFPPAAATLKHAVETNVLRALLNTPFRCHHCNQHHRGDSNRIAQCARAFTARVLDRLPFASWSPTLTPYYARKDWHEHNHRWTEHDEAHFTTLCTTLSRFNFSSEGPIATAAELASARGAEQLTARYRAWENTARQAIERSTTHAAPLLAQLEDFLHPPYPIGAPTGTFPTRWDVEPDVAAAQEIERVRQLFTPPARVAYSARHVELRIPRFGTMDGHRRPHKTDALGKIRVAFSSNLNTWTTYRKTTLVRFDPDQLGLDPAFWHRIALYRGTLTLTTQTFRLHNSQP